MGNYLAIILVMNPINYKTQNGLIKALTRASEKPMSVRNAWWFKSVEYALINNFGWTEENAAKFVAAYHPHTSIYKANS